MPRPRLFLDPPACYNPAETFRPTRKAPRASAEDEPERLPTRLCSLLRGGRASALRAPRRPEPAPRTAPRRGALRRPLDARGGRRPAPRARRDARAVRDG